MLRLLLNHHPDIAFNLESMFLISVMSDDGAFPDMQAYRTWLASDRVFQHSRFSIDESLDYQQLVDDFLIQKLGEKTVVGATIHHHYHRLNFLWPDAKYIYLLRDGRDVASSVKKIGFEGNHYESAKWWLRAEVEWEEAKKNLSKDNWIEIKYEQLTENPVQQLKRICAFVGVPYDDKVLDFSKDSSYKGPDSAYNFQWKRKTPQTEVQRIEALIGDRLVKRGYPLSGFPAIFISSVGKKVLRIDSRLKKYAFGVKRYGLLLCLGETIARRLKLRSVQERLSVKKDAIIDENLK